MHVETPPHSCSNKRQSRDRLLERVSYDLAYIVTCIPHVWVCFSVCVSMSEFVSIWGDCANLSQLEVCIDPFIRLPTMSAAIRSSFLEDPLFVNVVNDLLATTALRDML